jgi:hypothetical protein
MESEGLVWRLKSLRSWDRLAELAVFTGCSCGVVCFTSYRQSAQSEISEARNSKYINTVIILNLNVYYRQQNCALLGCCATSSVNFLPTFRDKLTILSSSVFCPLVVITYRCFGTTYLSQLQVSFGLVVISYRRFGTTYRSQIKVSFDFYGNILSTFRENLSVILQVPLALCGNILPTFQNKLLVTSSNVYWPLMVIIYRRFGRNYWSYLPASFGPWW